jgi:N-acetylated-alpha-linked acidic dipeptidase
LGIIKNWTFFQVARAGQLYTHVLSHSIRLDEINWFIRGSSVYIAYFFNASIKSFFFLLVDSIVQIKTMNNEKIDLEAQPLVYSPKRKNYFTIYTLCKVFSLIYIISQILLWLTSYSISPNSNIDYKISKEILLNSLKENKAGQWLYDYTRDNQLAGTNLRMVNYTLNKFKDLGLENSYIDQYTSYLSYPIEQSLNLINKKKDKIIYKPTLIEDEIDEDSNSLIHVPAFLGYAANGNVTAEYVYCHFGRYEDFKKLNDLGVDLKGKIAIVRYGQIFRGLKIKFAQDNGMIGVLIYTDTYDDGEVIEQNGFKPYPKGFARNPSAIQRGSAQFLSMMPGDPTTPGYAIKPGEDKERKDPYHSIPKIPALPISYKEVKPILQKLSGHGPKIDDWEGLVEDFDYSIGPNPKYSLNLYNNQDFNITIINNIMGKIKGEDDSKFILIGNHHDSWTPAAADPHSGSATLLEIIRAFGDLTKTGWKPKFSIVFASWDGEEYGLIGSTEFAEYYELQLKKSCIAYINTDVATVGSILTMHSSPLLNQVLLKSSKELNYPNSTISLYDHFIENEGKIKTLGSGSDFTVFLEHLGIPSVDLGFKNDLKNSAVYQYHTLYDSIYWMEKFGDPDYVFHNLMAKFISLIILHLSDEPVLNLRTNDYAIGLTNYFHDLKIPKKWLKDDDDKKNKLLYANHHNKNDHHHNYHHHHNDLKSLIKKVESKLNKLNDKTFDFDAYLEKLVNQHKHWDKLSYWERIKLHFKTKIKNAILQYFERHFLDEDGLNDRSWFKHIVYASGRYTGYKGQELPGLAEAIEDNDVKDFTHRLRKFDSILSTLIRMSSL